MSATVLSQGIVVAATPVLTRLYTAADFGVLAAVSAVVTIVGSVAPLRLDAAIPMADNDEDADSLLATGIWTSLFIGVAATAALLGAHAVTTTPRSSPIFSVAWFLPPIGIVALGVFNLAQAYAVRARSFTKIAQARIQQSAAGILTQLALGTAGGGPTGLVVGQFVLLSSGAATLLGSALRSTLRAAATIKTTAALSVLRRYRKYPTVSVVDTLANNASLQLPVIIIASSHSAAEAGLLAIALRAGQLPMSVIGNAAAQVFTSTASQAHRDGILGAETSRTLGLSIRGVPILLLAAAVAPAVAGFALGPEWREAGVVLRWMTPWLILQLLASPISMLMHARGRQVELLWITIGGLAGRSLATAAGIPSGNGVIFLCSASAVYYAGCVALFVRRSGATRGELLAELRRPFGVVLASAAAAIAVGLTLDLYAGASR